MARTKAAVYETLKVTALVILVLLTIVPIYIMLNLSFKTAGQILKSYWTVSFPLNGFNYQAAWKYVSRYIGNSIKVSGITVVIVVFSTALSAYAFAKLRFMGSKLFYAAILGLMMMPQVITFIPRFVIARDLRILYTQWGLILPYAAAAQSFAVFLLHSFFTQLPSELIESARIDGTSEMQCFLRIVLPISVPILTTVGIMNFMTTWDQFLWPLVAIREDRLRPITVGIRFLSTQLAGDYGPLMAAYVLSSVPLAILLLFTMRYYIAGLTAGALKA